MPKKPTLEELLKAGVHFGHQKQKRHPKMKPYIFGFRNGVHIINLEETQKKLDEALNFITESVAKGKNVLFVGTKRQAQAIVKKHAEASEMPYMTEGWIGGLMTNFGVIHKVIKKYLDLQAKQGSGELKKYTKKEQLDFQREIERLDKMVGGVKTLKKVPDIMFIIDLRTEKTAMLEAKKKGIPIVAICDTNVNPDNVNYVIPANDDATKAIELITGLVADAVKEGLVEAKKNEQKIKEGKKSAPPVVKEGQKSEKPIESK